MTVKPVDARHSAQRGREDKELNRDINESRIVR